MGVKDFESDASRDDVIEVDVDDLEDSGLRPRKEFDAALAIATRAALFLARDVGDRVSVEIRGDARRGVPARTVEGVVREIAALANGRERVRMLVEEDVEQVVLLERIARVAPCR